MKDPTHAWTITLALASVPLAFAWSIYSVGRAVSKWIEKKGNK
jgi:hypothetical protein